MSDSFYYMRARYYDSIIGRFVTADPAGLKGGYNFYTYVRNNPSSRADPSGLGEIHFDGGGGWIGSYYACYYLDIHSFEYAFCECMLYCLNVPLFRGCVDLWSSQNNVDPDCATYCGIYASQRVGGGGDGGPVADCPLSNTLDPRHAPPSTQPPPSSPEPPSSPSPLPPPGD